MKLNNIMLIIMIFVLIMLLLKSRKKPLPTPQLPDVEELLGIRHRRTWLDRFGMG